MKMEYRPLGRTGVQVSEICLGTMMFGGKADKTESIRIIDYALESGFTVEPTCPFVARVLAEDEKYRELRQT